MQHKHTINLDSYRLSVDSNEPRAPISDGHLALVKAQELSGSIPILKPRGVFATPQGGRLPIVTLNDLEDAGALKDDDSFALSIQFVDVKNADTTGSVDDPVSTYGPLFSVAEFLKAMRSGDAIKFHDWAAGLHGQPGAGGGGDPNAGQAEMTQLLNAPTVKAAVTELMTSGL